MPAPYGGNGELEPVISLRWETEQGKLKSSVKDKNRESEGLRNKVEKLQERVRSLQGRMVGHLDEMQPSSVLTFQSD